MAVIVDYGLRFSVHAMVAKAMKLGEPTRGVWGWWRDRERTASISYSVRPVEPLEGVLTLSYAKSGEPVDYDIRIVGEPCRFGGVRWFAICPHTRLKVSKLYLPPGAKRFLARKAWRLAYRSQTVSSGFARLCDQRDRLLLRTLKSDYPECPFRPKHMRKRTFEKHLAKLERLHDAMDAAMLQRFGVHAIL